jgi:hypothetical protein
MFIMFLIFASVGQYRPYLSILEIKLTISQVTSH